MTDAGLVFARFFHYSASLVLFGVALFPLYTYPRSRVDSVGGCRRMVATCWALSVVILVSGAFWFASVAVSMADTDISWETARFVLAETSYGTLCLLRLGSMVGIVLLLALVTLRPGYRGDLPLVALSAVLVGSLAGTGHAQVEEGASRLLHMLADALHLLGAGAWLGGLVGLLYLTAASLRPNSPESAQLEAFNAAHRFSGAGYVAVATIVASGLVNSWFLVSPLANLIETEYGRLLLVKVALFAVMVGLAGLNRFWIVPDLAKPAVAGVSPVGLRRLRLHIVLEECFGLAILLLVAFLGTIEPAISAAQ